MADKSLKEARQNIKQQSKRLSEEVGMSLSENNVECLKKILAITQSVTKSVEKINSSLESVLKDESMFKELDGALKAQSQNT